MIKILLADNQPLTAAGLFNMLRDVPNMTVVGEVNLREDFQQQLAVHRPHVLVVDPSRTGYVNREDLTTVRDLSPETQTLVISADTEKGNVLEVLQHGVIGYLTKDCSRDEIVRAVYAVARGEKFYCHKVLDVIMEKHFSASTEGQSTVLTTREKEILKFLASGYSTQRVADQLHLSPHTVHTHRKSIIRKLNIKSPTEFVIHAIDFGLINPKKV